MKVFSHLLQLLLFYLVNKCSCWQFFTSLSDLVLEGTAPEQKIVHSQYVYGDCKREDLIFYAHVHLGHMEVLGKVIVRGWVDLLRIPTCVILRAMANEEDTFRSTSFPFQMCVPRITYCHSRRRFKYFYYEWYIPTDYVGGMDWDIYFYGPPNLTWQ